MKIFNFKIVIKTGLSTNRNNNWNKHVKYKDMCSYLHITKFNSVKIMLCCNSNVVSDFMKFYFINIIYLFYNNMDHNLFTMQLLCLNLKSHIWRGFTRPALPVMYSTGKVTTTSSSRNNGKSHRRGVITVAIHTAIKNRDGVSRER